MINLFEYQNKVGIPKHLEGLEAFLDEVWNKREKTSYPSGNEEEKVESQRFLQFIHKSQELKATKYVGVIHFQGEKINLLPKVFYDSDRAYTDLEVCRIQNHILWWLSYCRKIKFPSYQTSLDSLKSDFFEVLIYLFSKYTRELLSTSLYQQYEEVNRELPFLKGKLDTPAYIRQNLSTARWHTFHCSYDAFVMDNEFNRIIKYVTTLLFQATTSQDNKKHLREILFILDEVSDVPATVEQCARISFNPMFSQFETVRDYCQLFLANSISFHYKNDLQLFAFLLPMEYVFEDFIFGFIDREIESVTAKAQRSDTYLDQAGIFALRPDLWLKTEQRSLIADTKYKIIYSDEADPKKGISQSDLYQMLAYAVRFEVEHIILFYPSTVKANQGNQADLIIQDQLANGREVCIQAFQLPILRPEALSAPLQTGLSLQDMFADTRERLRQRIGEILTPPLRQTESTS